METKFLELRNISKSFGKVSALARVNFYIKGEPEIVALIGDNGAGKSTLIKIISGVHAPDTGEIYIRGEKVDNWSVTKARAAGDGTRLAQTVDGVTTRYVSDIAAPLPQVLVEDRAGTQTAYLYGQGMVGAYDSGNWAYQHPDALGSVRQQTDAAGDLIVARGFTPFGEMLWQTGDPSGSFGYAGEQKDSYIKLIYLRSR